MIVVGTDYLVLCTEKFLNTPYTNKQFQLGKKSFPKYNKTSVNKGGHKSALIKQCNLPIKTKHRSIYKQKQNPNKIYNFQIRNN